MNIFHNPLLSQCAVKSVCDYLETFNADIDIYFNAENCNSEAEVDEVCEHLTVDEIEGMVAFSIYPNPASNKLHIVYHNNFHPVNISVFNQYGQIVLNPDPNEDQINVSGLSAGTYILTCAFGDQIARRKLIIK